MEQPRTSLTAIRRALKLLDREVWVARARTDAERLAGEDLTGEPEAW